MSRKSAERALLALEDCRIGGNRVFGVGASTKSELILTRCAFDGTDKTNIHRESGAIVQADALAEASPAASPEATPEGEKTEREKTESGQVKKKRKDKLRRQEDEDVPASSESFCLRAGAIEGRTCR